MSYREWRSICDHVGSPTRLMTMKPHLEFSSFGEALPLVVPIAVVLLPKRMISLEAGEVTWNYPWKLPLDTGILDPFC